VTELLVRRGGGAIGVAVALLVFTFAATHYIGDPVSLMLDRELASDEDFAALRKRYGFDRPVWEQFLDYAGNVLRGDFGESLIQHRSATAIVLEHLPATALLAGTTVVFSFVVSLMLALVAVRQYGRWAERAITMLATALACLPAFWLALALILLLAVRLSLMPTSGYGSWRNLILPVLALSAQPVGHMTQLLKTGMSAELGQPYVRVARAKGLRDRDVLTTHVFRNSAILATTMIGSMLAILLNGTVLAEAVFAWPGIGNLGLEAVRQRDLPVLTAVVFYAGISVTLVNLVVDIVYARLDPRVRVR
jgi:peptide/nickel transport system permease protein